MSKKYIISIGEHDLYPFDGPKQYCNDVIVRKTISATTKEQEQNLHMKLNLLLSINSPYLVQIKRILQIKNKAFVIDHQYVPESLSKNQKLAQNSFLLTLIDKLTQLCQNLTQSCIKTDLRIQDIGITSEGEPKMFISHCFDIIPDNQKNNLLSDYQTQLEKLLGIHCSYRHSVKAPSELSDYSYRLDKKITQIQDKINRRKLGKSRSSQGSGNSSDSLKKAKQPNIVLQSLSSKHSNTSQTSGKTCYSYIEAYHLNKPKIHKSSFNDFTTTSHKLNQSSREDSLKKRLTTALEKSKQTFKIYEKYFKRKRRV